MIAYRRSVLVALVLLAAVFVAGWAAVLAAEPDDTCAQYTTAELRQDCFVRFIANRLEDQRQQDVSNGFLEAFKPFSVVAVFAVGLWAGRSVG